MPQIVSSPCSDPWRCCAQLLFLRLCTDGIACFSVNYVLRKGLGWRAGAMRAVADVVVAGAGAAGLASAHFINQIMPNAKIILVSRHAPFALTSSASTECFRDHWTAPAMRAFMRRSVRLTEALASSSAENDARIAFTKRGYLYVSQDLSASAEAGSDSDHSSVLPQSALQRLYPWLSPRCTRAVLAKNAGWLSAHGLGMALMSTLQGSTMVGWDFVGASGAEDKLQGVHVRNFRTKEELHISCGAFVNATGPLLSATHQRALAGLSMAANGPLPVHNDVHAKVILHDVLGCALLPSPPLLWRAFSLCATCDCVLLASFHAPRP
jgi:hypothetical protein